jgi:chromosome partitioning protein
MRITVANLKGGPGKTTTSLLLAEAAAEEGARVLLVDADPQASLAEWASIAEEVGEPLRSTVVQLPTAQLGRRVSASARSYDIVVIDTPPGNEEIVRAAVRAADLVVVPSQTALLDLRRIGPTLDLAESMSTPAVVLLNKVRFGTTSLATADETIEEAGIPALKTVIPLREVIAAQFGLRPPSWILELHRAVLDELRELTA